MLCLQASAFLHTHLPYRSARSLSRPPHGRHRQPAGSMILKEQRAREQRQNVLRGLIEPRVTPFVTKPLRPDTDSRWVQIPPYLAQLESIPRSLLVQNHRGFWLCIADMAAPRPPIARWSPQGWSGTRVSPRQPIPVCVHPFVTIIARCKTTARDSPSFERVKSFCT